MIIILLAIIATLAFFIAAASFAIAVVLIGIDVRVNTIRMIMQSMEDRAKLGS